MLAIKLPRVSSQGDIRDQDRTAFLPRFRVSRPLIWTRPSPAGALSVCGLPQGIALPKTS